jgi:hypothetical protein
MRGCAALFAAHSSMVETLARASPGFAWDLYWILVVAEDGIEPSTLGL